MNVLAQMALEEIEEQPKPFFELRRLNWKRIEAKREQRREEMGVRASSGWWVVCLFMRVKEPFFKEYDWLSCDLFMCQFWFSVSKCILCKLLHFHGMNPTNKPHQPIHVPKAACTDFPFIPSYSPPVPHFHSVSLFVVSSVSSYFSSQFL